VCACAYWWYQTCDCVIECVLQIHSRAIRMNESSTTLWHILRLIQNFSTLTGKYTCSVTYLSACVCVCLCCRTCECVIEGVITRHATRVWMRVLNKYLTYSKIHSNSGTLTRRCIFIVMYLFVCINIMSHACDCIPECMITHYATSVNESKQTYATFLETHEKFEYVDQKERTYREISTLWQGGMYSSWHI